MDNTFDKIQSTERALNVLKKFERWAAVCTMWIYSGYTQVKNVYNLYSFTIASLVNIRHQSEIALIFSTIPISLVDFLILLPRLGIPDLGISDKYQRVLQNYGRDIEMVSRIYSKQKMDPPIARGLPPISGKILWVRQLYRRIQEPMELFQQHPGVLDTTEAKRIIRNYNRMAKVLLEFEMLYHQGWMAQVRFTVKIYWMKSVLLVLDSAACLWIFYASLVHEVKAHYCCFLDRSG